MNYFYPESQKENSDDDGFVRVEQESSIKDASPASHVGNANENANGEGSDKKNIGEISSSAMHHEGGNADDNNASQQIIPLQKTISLASMQQSMVESDVFQTSFTRKRQQSQSIKKKNLNEDQFYSNIDERDFEQINEVFRRKKEYQEKGAFCNEVFKENSLIDEEELDFIILNKQKKTDPPSFDVAFANDEKFLITTFYDEQSRLTLNIYDIQQKMTLLSETLNNKQYFKEQIFQRNNDLWSCKDNCIHFYKVTLDVNKIKTAEVQEFVFDLISKKLETFKFKQFIAQNVKPVDETEAVLMDEVEMIMFIKNQFETMQTYQSDYRILKDEEQQQYVGLIQNKNDMFLISIRKKNSVNEEVFTIKLTRDEYFNLSQKTISISMQRCNYGQSDTVDQIKKRMQSSLMYGSRNTLGAPGLHKTISLDLPQSSHRNTVVNPHKPESEPLVSFRTQPKLGDTSSIHESTPHGDVQSPPPPGAPLPPPPPRDSVNQSLPPPQIDVKDLNPQKPGWKDDQELNPQKPGGTDAPTAPTLARTLTIETKPKLGAFKHLQHAAHMIQPLLHKMPPPQTPRQTFGEQNQITEVFYLKISDQRQGKKDSLKAFIHNQEESFQIKVNTRFDLKEQLKQIQEKTHVAFEDEIVNNQVVDRHQSIVLYTVNPFGVTCLKHVENTEKNKERFDLLKNFIHGDHIVDRLIIIEDESKNEIKIIYHERNNKVIQTETYKSNQYEALKAVVFNKKTEKNELIESAKTIHEFKDDECYPFKKDEVQILGHEVGTYIEFKGIKKGESVKLHYSLAKRQRHYAFISEINEETSKKNSLLSMDKKQSRSIKIIIAVNGIDWLKCNLIEYRLRWQVDRNNNFVKWKSPQFLGDAKLFGCSVESIKLHISDGSEQVKRQVANSLASKFSRCSSKQYIDHIDSLVIQTKTNYYEKGSYHKSLPFENNYIVIKNLEELNYEYEDSSSKWTVKKIVGNLLDLTTKGSYRNEIKLQQKTQLIMSINRFSDKMITKFSSESMSFRDIFQLSQMRHEHILNSSDTQLSKWLFSEDPSIFQPQLCQNGLCYGFKLLKNPDGLKRALVRQIKNPDKSIISQIDQQIIGKDGIVDSLSDYKLQQSQPNDLHFHQQFKTLITLCYEGQLGEKINFQAILEVLLEHVIRHPSVLNQKVVQCEIPSMLLSEDQPIQLLKSLFLEHNDERCIQFFDKMSHYVDDLPHFYGEENYVLNYYKKDEDEMEQLESIFKTVKDIVHEEKVDGVPQFIKAVPFFQRFDLYNIRTSVSNHKKGHKAKPMTNFNFGAMVTKLIEHFPEIIADSDKVRTMIDDQFEEKTGKFFFYQFVWFIGMFLVPFFMVISGYLNKPTEDTVLTIGLVGALGMYSFEIMAMRVEGFSGYCKDGWNVIDQLALFFYFGLYALSVSHLGIGGTNMNITTDLQNFKKILKAMIVIVSWWKITWFQKQVKSLGLMYQLLVGVCWAVVPFLYMYFFWLIFFALMAHVLGANESLANQYTGLTPALGYLVVTFENSLGNIANPTLDFMQDKQKVTFFDHCIVGLIYLFWTISQILLLIVLLNFVIALISQYYEDVMNSATMHSYVMRHQLNHEYYVWSQFWVEMGFGKDKKIDAIILIVGDTTETHEEWQGLTQTMKKVVIKELDTNREILAREIKEDTTRQLEEMKDQVSNQFTSVNEEVKSVTENMNSQFAEIKALIEGLSLNK